MDLIKIAGIISLLLGAYSVIPYILSILKGKTKPHQFSWLVFVIMNVIVFISQFLEGARESILITFTFVVGSSIIFLLSLKYGVRESSRWDRILFTFALFTIALWVLTKNNALAIWLTLLIDVAATTMIVLKVRAQPYSEDPKPWLIATFAYVFSCITLIGQPLGIIYVRPLYGLICDAILVGFIYLWKSPRVISSKK